MPSSLRVILLKSLPISKVQKTNFYFAHPYQSWEQVLNEYTNGLVQEYFQKEKEFKEITDEQIVTN